MGQQRFVQTRHGMQHAVRLYDCHYAQHNTVGAQRKSSTPGFARRLRRFNSRPTPGTQHRCRFKYPRHPKQQGTPQTDTISINLPPWCLSTWTLDHRDPDQAVPAAHFGDADLFATSTVPPLPNQGVQELGQGRPRKLRSVQGAQHRFPLSKAPRLASAKLQRRPGLICAHWKKLRLGGKKSYV